jgi:hypothetical protein
MDIYAPRSKWSGTHFVDAMNWLLRVIHGRSSGRLLRPRRRPAVDNSTLIMTRVRALMHTEWTVSGPEPMKVYAIEVARRQQDGSWCWLIGDPFTVSREFCAGK